MTFDRHFLVLLLYYLVPGFAALLCGLLLKHRARTPAVRWSATLLQAIGVIPIVIIAVVVAANILGI